jgi:hypothetical protein
MDTTSTLRAASFADSIGVNLHMAGTSSAYGNVNKVIADLQYLGIDHVRDRAIDPTYNQTSYGKLAAAGIHFDLFIQPGTDLNYTASFAAAHPGALTALEGPNEINLWPVTYNGLTGTDAGVSYMSYLANAMQGNSAFDGVQLYNLTLAGKALGTAAGLGNVHVYPSSGAQPGAEMAWELGKSYAAMPGQGVVITETGYSTVAGVTGSVDLATQAKETLNTLMDAVKSGVQSTYLYELLDEPDASGTNPFAHFGLFDVNQNAKPVATAIHNLTSILADTGSNAETFATTAINYTVSGLSSAGGSLQFEKSSGAHDIIVWDEPKIWDDVAHKAIVAPNEAVTVALGATYATVNIYDPLKGATPIQTLHNVQSVQLTVTDHPLIIETAADAAGKAPTAGFTTALLNDTGASASDFITNDGRAALTGIAAAGSTITVKDGSTVVGTSSADASGAWALTTTLGAGTHQLSATATLSGVSSTYVDPQTIVVDTSEPAPSITSVSGAGATVAAGGSLGTSLLKLAGQAQSGDVVTVYADGAAVGNATADTSGAWTFDNSAHPLGGGVHSFTATATDVAGNVSAASTAFGVNLVGPAASFTESLYHDNGVSASDFITNNGALMMSGNGVAGATVTVTDGSTVVGTAYVHPDGTWSVGGGLGAGTHQLVATATLNGISATYSGRTIVVDTTAPDVPVIASVTDGSTTVGAGGTLATGKVTLQGSAEADGVVTLSADGTTIGTTTADATGHWSFDATSKTLANGAHTFAATVMDVAGNTSTASSFGLTVALPAPDVSFTQTLYHDNGTSTSDMISNNGAIMLSGTGTAGATVVVSDGSINFGTAYVHTDGTWGLGGSLGAGSHDLRATATLNGVSSTYQTSQTIVIDTSAPAAPTISSVMAGTTVVGAGGSVGSGALTLQGTSVANGLLTLYADGTTIGTTTADATGHWTFNNSAKSLATGAHTLSANVMGVAGNVSSTSTFAVNVTPPAPGVSFTESLFHDNGTSATDFITNNGALMLTGKGTPGATVVITDGSTTFGTAYVHADGAWAVGGGLGAGSHTLTATATLNGVSTAYTNPQVIVVDTSAPVAPTISSVTAGSATVGAGGSVATGSVTLQGTAVANGSVTLYADGAAIGTTTADATGHWTFDNTAKSLATGSHILSANVMEVAGNVSTTTTFGLKVAPPAPAVTFTETVFHDNGTSASDFITNNGAIMLTGKGTPGATVVVQDGSTTFGTAYVHADGAWALGGGLGAGSHTLTATATLNGVSTTYTNPQTIVVDTVAPTTAPTITSATEANGLVKLSGAAGAGDSIVTVAANGLPTVIATAGSSGAWSSSFAIPSGVAAYHLQSMDTAGNLSSKAFDLYAGDARNNVLTAQHSGDLLLGGAGNDTFVLSTATSNGVVIEDFTPGADRLQFSGFSAGATMTQLSGNNWQISDGVHTDVFQLANGARLTASGWFVS